MAVQIRTLDSTHDGFTEQLHALLAFEAETDDAIETAVAADPR
jgi:histidinol dehydrogenase